MDPEYHEAKLRYRGPKQKIGPRTQFQKHLQGNIYAQALATPYRRCPVTSVGLPKHFLISFKVLTDPKSPRTWFFPRDDAMKEPEDRSEQIPGPSMHVLARQTLLRDFSVQGDPNFKGYRRMMFRMDAQGAARLGLPSNYTPSWREDTDEFVVEYLRRPIVKSLLKHAALTEKEDRKYLIKLNHWDDAKEHNHRGCLLYLGQPPPTTKTGEQNETTDPAPAPASALAPPPERLSMLTIEGVKRNGKLPIHDLRALLGEEHMARLREESPLLRGGELFMLGRRRTKYLEIQLWKLQGYMAPEEPRT
ncbi:hypothetical protein B0H66DRAFT_600376 [Apodospora peruviana]|uniref:Uncharacterized protein n=1 Tax=Apodospora peruviana TaxID=516989 RepID=A0AAE0MBM2_9PEZI|nr:hypothetical protein B0H66DRAFT_600376 [Apodospora peruviana]